MQQPRANKRQPNWPLLILGGTLALFALTCLCCGGLFGTIIYLGQQGPDIRVVSGTQVKTKHRQTLEQLGMLQPEDQILYFYSDALLNLESGSYLLTNQHLALYNESWPQPLVILPFSQIETATFESAVPPPAPGEPPSPPPLIHLSDSHVTITTIDGLEYTFPLSPEQSGDTRFFQNLQRQITLQRSLNN